MASDRRTTSHQQRHQSSVEVGLAHRIVFLVAISLSAVGNGLTGDMIIREKLCSVRAHRICSRIQTHTVRIPYHQDARGFVAVAMDANGGQDRTPSPTFYQRLNSPRHILAPMVAQSDMPFRLMCEQLYAVDLSYTQMIHAVNFAAPHGETFRTNHLDVYPQSIVRDVLLGNGDRGAILVSSSQVNAISGLCHNDIEQSRKRILDAISEKKGIAVVSESSIDVKPTVVQIAAHDPDIAVKAANMILEMSGSTDALKSGDICPVAAIDLNLGCPQGIARKGRYGSFLHDEYPELTYNVLAKLRSNLPKQIGVTAKIRLPPTQGDADAGRLGNISGVGNGPQTKDERMRCLINCGVDLITVHGRTRFENKVTVGGADWKSVRQCVETARVCSGDEHYPIFSNGGIECWEDVHKCLDRTNASGVMSSESLLENPGLFCPEGAATTARDFLERQLRYSEMYLDYATIFPPLPGSLGTKGGSFNVIRSHLFKFLHRYLEDHPDLRTSLGDHKLNTIKHSRELVSNLRLRYDNFGEEELRAMKSWGRDSSWYRRHRHNMMQNEAVSSTSMEEKKQETRMRIIRIREERAKSSINRIQ